MRAVQLTAVNQFTLADVPAPTPAASRIAVAKITAVSSTSFPNDLTLKVDLEVNQSIKRREWRKVDGAMDAGLVDERCWHTCNVGSSPRWRRKVGSAAGHPRAQT